MLATSRDRANQQIEVWCNDYSKVNMHEICDLAQQYINKVQADEFRKRIQYGPFEFVKFLSHYFRIYIHNQEDLRVWKFASRIANVTVKIPDLLGTNSVYFYGPNRETLDGVYIEFDLNAEDALKENGISYKRLQTSMLAWFAKDKDKRLIGEMIGRYVAPIKFLSIPPGHPFRIAKDPDHHLITHTTFMIMDEEKIN